MVFPPNVRAVSSMKGGGRTALLAEDAKIRRYLDWVPIQTREPAEEAERGETGRVGLD